MLKVTSSQLIDGQGPVESELDFFSSPERSVNSRPVNYVLSWLSVVGPVVGLDVSLNYSLELHPAAPISVKPD